MNLVPCVVALSLYLAAYDEPIPASPNAEPQRAVLSDAEGDAWLKRLRTTIPEEGWSVTRDNDRFVIVRKQPVGHVNRINAPSLATEEEQRIWDREHVLDYEYKMALRFSSKLSQAEYDRFAAVNRKSDGQAERRRQDLAGITQKFFQFLPDNREEQARLERYNQAVLKLPWHEVPEYFSADYGVFIEHPFVGIDIYDADEQQECASAHRSVTSLFGAYDPKVARGVRSGDARQPNAARWLVEIISREDETGD